MVWMRKRTGRGMIDLTGDGVLALWNGVEPSRKAEYDAWHTREHVAERISVPGMRGARRYVRLSGPLPEYLTLYALDDTSVLTSEPYRKLLDNPTVWSKSMRPSFRGFMRLACRRVMTLGGGLGGALAAAAIDETNLPALRQAAETLITQPAVTVVHVLARDPDIPDVPFKIGGDTPAFPNAGAILIESYDDNALSAALPAIKGALGRAVISAATLTTYRLAYALDRVSLDRIEPMTEWPS
jgi:hypothetical protein